MSGRLRLQSWLRNRRIPLVESSTLTALVGAYLLAVNAWAQAPNPNPSQFAPLAPAIPMPTEASPQVQPSRTPLRTNSQSIDATPSGAYVAPASTRVSPATAGPAGPTTPSALGSAPTAEGTTPTAIAPRPSGQVTIDSDLQQADQTTGIITATGNVRIIYPDQRVVATARQAQYFTKEDRVVLSGDVDVIQEGEPPAGRAGDLPDQGRSGDGRTSPWPTGVQQDGDSAEAGAPGNGGGHQPPGQTRDSDSRVCPGHPRDRRYGH